MAPNRAIIVVDLGYGDGGKGATVDFLTREVGATAVVRYCGGAQAAHNVVDGRRHHTFAQWGSGTFVDGVKTHLSKHMMVNPFTLHNEAESLGRVGVHDAWERHTVHKDALITTPLHMLRNKHVEIARGGQRHGSTGMGIGETMSDSLERPDDVLRASDLTSSLDVLRKVEEYARLHMPDLAQREVTLAAEKVIFGAANMTVVDDDYFTALLAEGNVIFEGSQGVLLDQSIGFHPYTTWADVTPRNADRLLQDAGHLPGERVGVLRAYSTRHGPGPFPTEDASLRKPEPHNGQVDWTGPFRVGHFDLVATTYAAEAIGGVDSIALSHLDQVDGVRACIAYRQPSGEILYSLPVMEDNTNGALTRFVEGCTPVYAEHDMTWEALPAPVDITANGPSAADRKLLVRTP